MTTLTPEEIDRRIRFELDLAERHAIVAAHAWTAQDRREARAAQQQCLSNAIGWASR